jgi:hypothetical protein
MLLSKKGHTFLIDLCGGGFLPFSSDTAPKSSQKGEANEQLTLDNEVKEDFGVKYCSLQITSSFQHVLAFGKIFLRISIKFLR